MLEGSIAFTLSGATEFKKLGFGSLTTMIETILITKTPTRVAKTK